MDHGNRTARDGETSNTTLTQQIQDVIELDKMLLKIPRSNWDKFGCQVMKDQLNRLMSFLLDISKRFQDQQRAIPETVNYCLRRMEPKVELARSLIHRLQLPQSCFDRLLGKPKLCEEIKEWKASLNEVFKHLQTEFSISYNVSSALQEKEVEPHDGLVRTGFKDAVVAAERRLREAPHVREGKPHDGLVRTGFKDAVVAVDRWLREAPDVCIIGVCGGAGVGKTRLLRNVYNTYKVSDFFDVVIWVTVAQSGIPELQDCIARTLNLDLAVHHSNSEIGLDSDVHHSSNEIGLDLDLHHSNNEMWKHVRKIKPLECLNNKVKLLECLKAKKFLLIFDDMWSPLDLNKLGVEFSDDKGSKIICSSRMSDVIEEIGAKNSIYIEPLTREEAWELFRSVAFKDSHLPQALEHIARHVASECKGLPLAINVIAATMRGNISVNEWSLALRQLKTPIHHNFPNSYLRFDEQLYRILRWSYERLPDANFKSCFMYCAMFPRDEEIEVDKWVGMWIAEGFVWSKNPLDLIDTAHGYIKVLVDRCFFQVTHIPHGAVLLKAYNTLRDVAIYIGKTEGHSLSEAGLRLQTCPMGMETIDWKRISLYGNNIKSLPAKGLKCRNLVSLIIGSNKELEKVPESFLVHLPSIRVLDLSRTKIKCLPGTLWQLTQLKYLDVSYTQIEYLSEDIGRLFQLQFLNLSGCSRLKSLPKVIGNLCRLQSLNASGCSKITSIPSQIYEIKSLKSLQISQCNVLS